ncbi:MAG: glycosyltransferase [Lachnospiraceae bacterium]
MSTINSQITIITPIYNQCDYISNYINCLISQDYPFRYMQIILIDDGSTDKTRKIVKKYQRQYRNIELICLDHSGVAKARNAGIRKAKGRFIFYLDCDDLLTPNTIKNVNCFFLKYEKTIDLVTYPLCSYKDSIYSEKLEKHFRYKYLQESGVYDLEENPFVTQTTMNIVVKNNFSNNILFDENLSFTEDQSYCLNVLKSKMKLGFCSAGEYQYICHSDSSSRRLSGACYLFEQCMSFWESVFAEYTEDVPAYIQAAYLNDLAWKNSSNILFPYHYNNEKLMEAKERIRKLIVKVSNQTILEHPAIILEHKLFWIRFKGKDLYSVWIDPKGVQVLWHDYKLQESDKVEICFRNFQIRDSKIIIKGYLKSNIFSVVEKPLLQYQIKYRNSCITKTIDLFEDSASYFNSHTKTRQCWGFTHEISGAIRGEIIYFLYVEEVKIKMRPVFEELTPFANGRKEISVSNKRIQVTDNGLIINSITKEEQGKWQILEALRFENNKPTISYLRKETYKSENERIWLYYDCKGVEKDNGYYQFCHDLKKQDGIKKYYISANSIERNKEIFSNDELTRVIAYGSTMHQLLFIKCEMILTAYIENYNLIPFAPGDIADIADLLHFNILYLQHGVLHAYIPWKYTYLGNLADYVVISSQYEKDLFTQVYHYPPESLLPYGMPRLNYLHRDVKESRVILYAPSWRAYLVEHGADGEWNPRGRIFWNSEFCHGLLELCSSVELKSWLYKNNYKLKIKLHPIFSCYYNELCEYSTKQVNFVVDYDDKCDIFITDYSSYVFDFVKNKTPIIYYLRDEKEFYSGMNGYFSLSLPLEEGFGNVTRSANELLKELNYIISNNKNTGNTFTERMEEFYYKDLAGDSAIYNWLLNRV